MVIIPKKSRSARRTKRIRWSILFLVVLVLLLAIGRHLFFKEVPVKDALTRIKERGYLIALTDKNSLNYFFDNGHPEGFQLELLESFATYLDVPLKIIASNDVSKLYYYLDLNAGDLIALNLPVSREGKKDVHFSAPLGETRIVLIQRKKGTGKKSTKYITDIKDFSGDTVYFRNNLFIEPILHPFASKAEGKVTVLQETVKNTLELIRMVSEGKIEYAVCDENLAMVVKRYYRNIDASLVLSKFYEYAWATSRNSDSLLLNINDWLMEMKKKELKKIYLAYYNNPGVTRYFQCDYCSFNGTKLSPFDDAIKSSSKLIRWDWRLLASLVYEESNFQLGLVSSHKASGLMQLMPETARRFGMDSLSPPSKQILAGVKYIRFLDNELSSEIRDPIERINFMLASYNVGLGKVMKAREKARQNGLNPDKWNRNVDYYLTRKSKKHPESQPDTLDDNSLYGTAGGFVDNIMVRYMHYRNIIPE